jgi:hypothetical protein
VISIYPHWQGETEIHLLYKKNWQFKFLVAPLIQADCQTFGLWETKDLPVSCIDLNQG